MLKTDYNKEISCEVAVLCMDSGTAYNDNTYIQAYSGAGSSEDTIYDSN